MLWPTLRDAPLRGAPQGEATWYPRLACIASEHFVERLGQGGIEIGQGHRQAEIDQRGHAVARDAAGHDSRIVRQVGLDVYRQAMERHPVADAHADGADLVLARTAVRQTG